MEWTAGRLGLAASTCAKRVKSRGEAGLLRMAVAIRGMPGSEFEPRRPLQKSPPIRVVIFFRVLLGAHRRVSRLPPAVAVRQPGHFLETASLHPPQAALRRFPRRGRVTSPTRSAGPRSKSGAGRQRKRGNTFSQSVFCHCKIQKHMLRLCKHEEGFL